MFLEPLDKPGMAWAQAQVKQHHYLRAYVPFIARPEGYAIVHPALGRIGCFIVCRTQSTRCYPWYGSVEDVEAGRCESTRWQVLNLARVWFDPCVQHGGQWFGAEWLPGFVDRRGAFRSTLASVAIELLIQRVGYDYLIARPPVFPDQPYEHRWLLSYCDTRLHRGVIYRAAGFERVGANRKGIETWRIRLPPLTPEQDAAVLARSATDERARRFRAKSAVELGQAGLGL